MLRVPKFPAPRRPMPGARPRPARRSRHAVPAAARWAGALALLAGCDAGSPAQVTPATAARLALVPSFQRVAPVGLSAVATQLRIVVRRENSAIVADTSLVVPVEQPSVSVQLELDDVPDTERLSADVTFDQADGLPLFRGARAGVIGDGTPVDIALDYVGPAAIELTSGPDTLESVGDSVRLTARVLDADGAVIDGAPVVFVVDAPDVAAASDSGVVRGLAGGTASVVAEAYGLRSAPVQLRVPNRYVWLGGDGIFSDATRWLGGRIPTEDAAIDITADGTYTVRLRRDWFGASSVWTIGAPENSGRQTLLVNPGDSLFGVLLTAASIEVGASGIVDGTELILDVGQLRLGGEWLVRRGMSVGGSLRGFEGSSLVLVDSAFVEFRTFWESPPTAPPIPPGGPMRTAGALRGNGSIFNRRSDESFEVAGTLAPSGRLSLFGAARIAAGAQVDIAIRGTTPVTDHDLIETFGPLDIRGGLLALETASYQPPDQTTVFPFRTFGGRTGTFADASGRGLVGGRTLTVDYRAGAIAIVCCIP
jgi:hypothetical protein